MRLSIFAALAVTLVLAGCGASPHTSPRHPPSRPAGTQSAGGSIHPPGWGEAGPKLTLSLTPSATATMYDSITLGAIPRAPFAAAGYSGGAWRTYPQLRSAYPQTHTVSIAVFAWERAACLDVEPGDAAPWEAPGWVRADERAGYRKPCLYSDWSEWTSELAPALRRAGIVLASILRWVASYVNHPQLLPGFDADQYTDACLGRNLDCSLVLRSFLAAAQPPLKPKPKPRPKPATARALDALLGAHSARDPHGHNCADPPYRHAYPSARYNHACAAWAHERRELLR